MLSRRMMVSEAERLMPSPADRQAEANEDVRRIARAIFTAAYDATAPDGAIVAPSQFEPAVRKLLLDDVIRVGSRPKVERPMEGQTTLCEHQWVLGSDLCANCGVSHTELFGVPKPFETEDIDPGVGYG